MVPLSPYLRVNWVKKFLGTKPKFYWTSFAHNLQQNFTKSRFFLTKNLLFYLQFSRFKQSLGLSSYARFLLLSVFSLVELSPTKTEIKFIYIKLVNKLNKKNWKTQHHFSYFEFLSALMGALTTKIFSSKFLPYQKIFAIKRHRWYLIRKFYSMHVDF